jgi:hypothetical protein
MGALRKLVVVTLAVLLTAWFCPPARAEGPRTVIVGEGVGGNAAEIQRLAQREQQAPQLEKFRGGAHISISTTAIIIILLLVIIIIILV